MPRQIFIGYEDNVVSQAKPSRGVLSCMRDAIWMSSLPSNPFESRLGIQRRFNIVAFHEKGS